jgi:large subunit ribosomal protein L27
MAHKKGAGSTKNGRDSNAKRLGLKRCGGEFITSGTIILRQRSLKIQPGKNIGQGRDYTLYALSDGYIHFDSIQKLAKQYKVLTISKDY